MFNVRFFPSVEPELLLEVAAGLYDTYEYPRLEFNKREYLERVLLQASEGTLFMCFEGDRPIGGITVSDLMYDLHFNGTGKHITNFVVLPRADSRRVVALLLREFRLSLYREGECTWYSTTHRRDLYTLTTRYWRL